MGNIFITSDTHDFHRNMLGFKKKDGTPVRPEFQCSSDGHPKKCDCVHKMNEFMVEQWNSVVKDGDKVYHAGDVTFYKGKEWREMMSRRRGQKRLLLGNHDDGHDFELTKWFKKVGVWRVFKDQNFVLTHIPISKVNFGKVQFNVHGHTHYEDQGMPYVNICVEKTNYRPLHIDEVVAIIKKG